MGDFFDWPKDLGFDEALRCFLVISVIGFFVSFIFNRKSKSCPVLAVELSILATLLIYPAINAYLNMATMSDYGLAGDVTDFPRSPLVFFFPLPVCVLVSLVFYAFRARLKDPLLSPSIKGWTKARKAAWILAILAGGLWLCVNMAFEKSFELLTVARFFVYTLCGFAAYLAVELILWMVRLLLATADGQQAQDT
ncbi:MAG: hypothetical protein KAY65_13260 [Planctomycetes bacterium]|nr:hypothetical protein [Planctomycetota bacterium]